MRVVGSSAANVTPSRHPDEVIEYVAKGGVECQKTRVIIKHRPMAKSCRMVK
jgi:hypothetical protein